MAFHRAERKRVFLKLAITGPTGSGKTYSALRLAFGLGGRVAFIDTENGSGSLYAHLGEYDVNELPPPFTVQKYTDAILEAERLNYDVLIIDSATHAWAGDGGLLDQKAAKDQRGGNGFANWAEIKRIHERFKSALLQSRMHVILTMRSKMEYQQETDERGRGIVRRVGLAPIQQDEMPYEFTTVFDVDMLHVATTSKDRTGLFTDQVAQITEQHGHRFREWLQGAPEPAPLDTPVPQVNARPQERPAVPRGSYLTEPAESRGDARATAEAAVNRTQRPASTLVEGAASTPNAQCPDCHAPAGKPHGKTCPQNGGAGLQPTPSGRTPQGDREHQNRRLFAVYAEACEAAGVKVEDSLMRTHCGKVLSQLKGYSVTVTSRSNLSTEDLAALADHISRYGIPHERQSAPSGELEMGE